MKTALLKMTGQGDYVRRTYAASEPVERKHMIVTRRRKNCADGEAFSLGFCCGLCVGMLLILLPLYFRWCGGH
jgi:hypothetical protein